MISLDTESGGLDLFHGVRPFCVVWCTPAGPQCREWEVSPLTREVKPFHKDVTDIRNLVRGADRIVFHHAKFDVRSLSTVGIDVPWEKVEDTIVAAHILFSAPPHNLTRLADVYLDTDIKPFETSLERAVKKCRSVVQQARLKESRLRKSQGQVTESDLSPYRTWKITETDDPDLPSAKGEDGGWHSDYFFPKLLHAADPDNADYAGFDTVLRDYALTDAAVTYRLWQRLEPLLKERGLWKVYRHKMETLPALYRMENRGMSVHVDVVRQKTEDYTEQVTELHDTLLGVARLKGYDLTLPKGPTNHSLDNFVFGRAPSVTDPETGKSKRNPKGERRHEDDTLNIEPVGTTESGAPSFDYDNREIILSNLEPGTLPYLFVEAFHRRADYAKALDALTAYQRFMVPTEVCGATVKRRDYVDPRRPVPQVRDGVLERPQSGSSTSQTIDHGGSGGGDGRTYVLHPSFNATGTQTTRLSSSNPNAQNISKQGTANLRECFGPKPGRIWYSFDATGIELIIPAIVADETEILRVMLNPDDGPYYGSYHLLIFDTLHTEMFAKHGKDCKSLFEDSWYQWVKNGNFARQYGAQETTVDATYRVKGAYRKIADRFPRIDRLNRETIARANATGRVIALPNRSIDPDHGYPIVCRRNAYDRISPTVPFAYFVSGSAGVWMNSAIVACDKLMERWRRDEGYDGYLVATVHDEIVFDLPADVDNRGKIGELREAMEQVGRDMGVPVRVAVERHDVSWAKGEVVK